MITGQKRGMFLTNVLSLYSLLEINDTFIIFGTFNFQFFSISHISKREKRVFCARQEESNSMNNCTLRCSAKCSNSTN